MQQGADSSYERVNVEETKDDDTSDNSQEDDTSSSDDEDGVSTVHPRVIKTEIDTKEFSIGCTIHKSEFANPSLLYNVYYALPWIFDLKASCEVQHTSKNNVILSTTVARINIGQIQVELSDLLDHMIHGPTVISIQFEAPELFTAAYKENITSRIRSPSLLVGTKSTYDVYSTHPSRFLYKPREFTWWQKVSCRVIVPHYTVRLKLSYKGDIQVLHDKMTDRLLSIHVHDQRAVNNPQTSSIKI